PPERGQDGHSPPLALKAVGRPSRAALPTWALSPANHASSPPPRSLPAAFSRTRTSIRVPPSAARIVLPVVTRPPLLRPERAPQVPAHPLDHVPDLEPREPVLRDVAPAIDQPEQTPRK